MRAAVVPGERKDKADATPEVVERLKKQALAWQKTLPEGPFDKTAGKNEYPWPKPAK